MTKSAAEEWFVMIDTDEDGYIGFAEMEKYCVGKLAFTKEQVDRIIVCIQEFNIIVRNSSTVRTSWPSPRSR